MCRVMNFRYEARNGLFKTQNSELTTHYSHMMHIYLLFHKESSVYKNYF
jgi:hypothetical protein